MPPSTSAYARAGYLGPQGTFSEEALLGSVGDAEVTPVALETIRDAVTAVQDREVEWSLVPIENSIEGSVTVTLDTLVGGAPDVVIVGELVLPVRHYLIAPDPIEIDEIKTVISHPHVPGQCTRFLHERLPHVRVRAATSTADAVRLVAERAGVGVAAIGTRLAAELYGCTVIAEGIQDREDNETRFVWLARADSAAGAPPLRSNGAKADSKTSLVFWGAGADRAGWLVLCLDEFARRGINLTKIESRPMRERLGQYMFFLDLQGSLTDALVADALAGLQDLCEQVRVFGCYPTAGTFPEGRLRAR
jgi:prephenate dehydratase